MTPTDSSIGTCLQPLPPGFVLMSLPNGLTTSSVPQSQQASGEYVPLSQYATSSNLALSSPAQFNQAQAMLAVHELLESFRLANSSTTHAITDAPASAQTASSVSVGPMRGIREACTLTPMLEPAPHRPSIFSACTANGCISSCGVAFGSLPPAAWDAAATTPDCLVGNLDGSTNGDLALVGGSFGGSSPTTSVPGMSASLYVKNLPNGALTWRFCPMVIMKLH
jgi:hypothetical protein